MVTRESSRPASAEQRLKELGIELPAPPEPYGIYVEAVQSANLLFLTGMLPTEGAREIHWARGRRARRGGGPQGGSAGGASTTKSPGAASTAHASVSINSLGPIDNLQIAATGLDPGRKYRVFLVGGTEPQELVAFSAGIGGSAIAQTLGPLRRAVSPSQTEPAMRLEIRAAGAGTLVHEQTGPSTRVSR